MPWVRIPDVHRLLENPFLFKKKLFVLNRVVRIVGIFTLIKEKTLCLKRVGLIVRIFTLI